MMIIKKISNFFHKGKRAEMSRTGVKCSFTSADLNSKQLATLARLKADREEQEGKIEDKADIKYRWKRTTSESDGDYLSSSLVDQKDQAGRFGSNHVLINIERKKRNINTLNRIVVLDEIAKRHAENMAQKEKLYHSKASQTMPEVVSRTGGCTIIGENVAMIEEGSGRSPSRQAHVMFYNSERDRQNMLDERYKSFGIGSCVSSKGNLYICQLYKG